MNIQDLLKSGANVSVTVGSSELKEFASTLIEQTKKELEAVVLAEKAESYLTIKQVSEMLSVNVCTLWRWNRSGYLKTIEFGGGRRYKKSEVKALMNGGK